MPLFSLARPLLSTLVMITVALLLSSCNLDDSSRKNDVSPTSSSPSLRVVQSPQPTSSAAIIQPTLPNPTTLGKYIPETATLVNTQVSQYPPTAISTTVPALILAPTLEQGTKDVWGTNLLVGQVPVLVDKGHIFNMLTATPDVRFLVGSVTSRSTSELGGTEPGKAVLMDVQSHKITELHVFPRKDSQMLAASADDEWVIWAEAAQEPGFFSNWVIYSYNRKTNAVKQVATAPHDTNGIAFPSGPLVAPKVDHGIVVWSQIPMNGPDKVHSLVVSANLSTEQLSILTDLGQQPTISWPYVGWEAPNSPVSQAVPGRPDTHIHLLNLQTGDAKDLKSPHNISYFALSSDTVVWITEHGEQVVLTDVNETTSQVIAQADPSQADILQYPSLNHRLVTWVSYARVAAWDRVEQKVINVVNPYKLQGTSIINGNAYVWQSGGSSEQMDQSKGDLGATNIMFNVVDCSSLPTH